MNHVERDCRMRTTQAPGDRTLLGLFFAPCPSERHTQGLPLQDKILIPDLVAAVCEVPKNRKLPAHEDLGRCLKGEQAQAP